MTTETSTSSNDFFLPLKKRMRPVESSPDTTLIKRMRPDESSPYKTLIIPKQTTTLKYKGVVEQPNGHWGAQIYANHQRIWLGTFNTAAIAATAYDSASIKLRNFDANTHRNFPWNDCTILEPTFQRDISTETVLNMIKEGSYQQKFREFLRNESTKVGSSTDISGTEHIQREKESDRSFACTQLFQKELTPSDVGKLNRLVIPKKYAVKHLPFISDYQEEGEIGVQDVEVVFYDKAMRQWKFRYCYWRSSQSFVFTRGWNSFVKEKNLKEKDVVVFYNCEFPSNVERLEGQSKYFLMIDVQSFLDNGFVAPEEDLITENLFNSKLKDQVTESEEKKGFMLFGVRIQ